MTEPRILTDDELRQIGALQVTPGSWWPSRHNGPNDVDRGKIWGFRAGPPPVQMVVVAEINRFIGTAEDQQLIAAAPDLRRTALYLLQRAERAEAHVAELEAPGECNSIHKLRAQVTDLQAAVERVRPAALESVPDLAPQPPPTPGEADDLGFTATPARYAAHGRETIDRMRDLARATFADPGEADAAFAFFCRASALKYDDRAGLKGPAGPDRKKAAWYRQMADHVDGFAADPRDGRPDFAPYAEPLVEPVALGDVWEVTPRTFGRSRHMLCAAGDPESVILMLEVSPGADASGRVDWFCSPPGREFQESYFDRGTIMAQPGTLDAAIEEGCRLARASYDRWSQAQMARIGGAAPYG